MRFDTTELYGAWLIALEHVSDHRGFFARTFCAREFDCAWPRDHLRAAQHVLLYETGDDPGQALPARARCRGQGRQCVRGAIYDVIVDLRRSSPTYRRWQGFELSAENRRPFTFRLAMRTDSRP